MNKNLRSKRGFSTILVSAMMLSSLSTMGVAVLGWSNNVVSTQENRISELYTERSNALQEVFTIEDVLFDGVIGIKYVHVAVKNIGELPVKVTSITINNNKTSTNQLISPNQSATINIAYEWTNSLHDIIVQTERNNTIKQSWMQ